MPPYYQSHYSEQATRGMITWREHTQADFRHVVVRRLRRGFGQIVKQQSSHVIKAAVGGGDVIVGRSLQLGPLLGIRLVQLDPAARIFGRKPAKHVCFTFLYYLDALAFVGRSFVKGPGIIGGRYNKKARSRGNVQYCQKAWFRGRYNKKARFQGERTVLSKGLAQGKVQSKGSVQGIVLPKGSVPGIYNFKQPHFYVSQVS